MLGALKWIGAGIVAIAGALVAAAFWLGRVEPSWSAYLPPVLLVIALGCSIVFYYERAVERRKRSGTSDFQGPETREEVSRERSRSLHG